MALAPRGEAGARNVIAVSPPRSGKTKTAVWTSEPFLEAGQYACMFAHREELVRQIADEYAEHGHTCRIIAPGPVVSDIIHRQTKQYGRSYVSNNAFMTIGSVQTLRARAEENRQWASRVGLWICDEAHHVLTDNMWGKAIAQFPNARGLGFTATPGRTDRKSLARSQGGMFDAMVKGVTARQLINEGFICEYRIIAPPSSIDRTSIRVGTTGDFTQKGLTDARRHSTITGDVVASYLRYVPGEQAIVFAVDIEHAEELCRAYQDAGIRAEAVSSKTPSRIRKLLMDKFTRGVFQVLVNVDLFGEGLNVKGITAVIMARPTQSFVLYVQQFFRALTRADGKHHGTIIDHAGNVGYFGKIYGLPDTYNDWVLESDERGKRGTRDPSVIPVTTCVECFMAYEATKTACPYCGAVPEPAGRSKPSQVDGDLIELDGATLAALRGEVARIDRSPLMPHNANAVVQRSIEKRWRERQEAQHELREAMARWCGPWHAAGETDREIQKRFWFRFGIDMLTAQTLGATDATGLRERIENDRA
jgi:DNA repair protein RadD